MQTTILSVSHSKGNNKCLLGNNHNNDVRPKRSTLSHKCLARSGIDSGVANAKKF
jgi:hypothetical protein